MTDIVERLRETADEFQPQDWSCDICSEAADEIERLRQQAMVSAEAIETLRGWIQEALDHREDHSVYWVMRVEAYLETLDSLTNPAPNPLSAKGMGL